MTFVRDYLQLHFNPPPLLNADTSVTIRCGGQSATFGEKAFANLLIAQINKVVSAVDLRAEEALEIRFEDGSTVAYLFVLKTTSAPRSSTSSGRAKA